jgi:hypothetical protein
MATAKDAEEAEDYPAAMATYQGDDPPAPFRGLSA